MVAGVAGAGLVYGMGRQRANVLKIIISEGAGFCFGVKRAIHTAFQTAREYPGEVYTLGPIIHNPQVVDKLRSEGVGVLDSPSGDVNGNVVIIRSHGVAPDVYREMEARGVKLVDSTCPFVKKAQDHARRLREEGFQVMIVGEADHPEVQGLCGYAGEDVVVAGRAEDVDSFELKRKVGIIVQTTQSFSNLQRVVHVVLPRVAELKIHNTICRATRQRQAATTRLAEQVDLMLVVGGKNSANTKRLRTLCEERSVRVVHVETADEIDPLWFDGLETVGVTGGASTPDWIIREVEDRLKRL